MVFDANTGNALQVTLIDMGERFRLIVTECVAVQPLEDMPKLPVARAMWKLKPSFSVATEAWILSGGAHHTVMTYDLSYEVLQDYADILGIECIYINEKTNINQLKKDLLFSDMMYKVKG